MAGIELVDDELVVGRAPNELDTLAISFTRILDDLNIGHVYVAGYLAILTGRSRSTEDIDVLLEPLDEAESDRLAERLEREGMWRPAMPLDDLHMMLSGGDNTWVAPDEQVIPHIEANSSTTRQTVPRLIRRSRPGSAIASCRSGRSNCRSRTSSISEHVRISRMQAIC